jgi:glyoxylase-like metal-dependent hydrolase (beta-lactamase superfamily II)
MNSQIERVSKFGLVNAYLVREDDGFTLIDTGMSGMQMTILGRARTLGAPIVRIALTHAHGDHIGSLDRVADALPGVEVAISARDARLMAGDKTLQPGEEGKLRGSYPGAKTAPTRLLEPGDRVGSLEVVAAPGHTPGHVALLDTRDRTLLCGDAFSTLGGVATSAKANWRFPLPAMATWDRGVELDSARALRALNPARLAPGHGPVVEDPAAAMDAAIRAAA